MFHKAVELSFGEGTSLEVRFQNGKVKRYDMASLFNKYPQLRALENRDLFLSGKLMVHTVSYGMTISTLKRKPSMKTVKQSVQKNP